MDDLALPRRIRSLRHRSKLTLAQVADLTGFTKIYLSMVERGKKSPPIATLNKIAQALSVEMSVFFPKARIKNGLVIGRKKDRRSIVQDGSQFGYRYQAIASSTGQPKRMEAFITAFSPRRRGGGRLLSTGRSFSMYWRGKSDSSTANKKFC